MERERLDTERKELQSEAYEAYEVFDGINIKSTPQQAPESRQKSKRLIKKKFDDNLGLQMQKKRMSADGFYGDKVGFDPEPD